MSRRRWVAEHALIFVTALATLPLAALLGEAIGPLVGGAVIVCGMAVALAATRRLRSPTALVPTVGAMASVWLYVAVAALSDPVDGCSDGRTGFMDGCVPDASIITAAGVALLVLTVVLCFLQLIFVPGADAVRDRLPPSERRPMDDAWVEQRVGRSDDPR